MKALAFAVICGGCAVVDSTIPIAHARLLEGVHAAAARSVSIVVTREDGGRREGVKKNGYGVETGAGIFTDPPPELALSAGLRAELEHAGLEVSAAAPVAIRVEIGQFFTEPEVGLWAGDVHGIVDATVIVRFTKETFERRFTGLGKVTTPIWSDLYFQRALQEALDDFLRKAVPAIVTLVDQQGANG